jgi:HK97 family phage portal protein
MKLLPAFLRRKDITPMSSATLAQLLAAAFGGGATKSGATVTAETALQVSVVLACVRVIAEGVAQVPFRVMQETPDGRTRLPAKKHPLWDVLHRKPNRWQSSFGLRETIVMHAALTGNGYAFKSRVGAEQRIAELIIIPPHRCKPELADNGTMLYQVKGKDGSTRTLAEDDVWHLRGPSWDGSVGMDVMRLAREAIGLAMMAEETQGNLHAKGVRTTGVYSIEGTLSKDQYEQLKGWVAKEFAGTNGGSPMILDRNAKWQPTTMTGVDAQHLETRAFQVMEICRSLRVMPIMAGHSDKAATYASAEQMFIAHLVHTLTPWYERVEQSADCQLLSDADRAAGYYTFLDPVGMLRGALRDTAEYLYRLVSIGTMTRNEARERLDLNPIEGLDEPLTPANMFTSAENGPAAAGAAA